MIDSVQEQDWSFDLQNYVVLFLDVMGQRDEIFRFRTVPDDRAEAERVVLKTAGFVRQLRKRVGTVLAPDPKTKFMKSLSKEQQAELKLATHMEARVSQTLSDALVISAPVGSDPTNMTQIANGIHWALLTASWLQLTALADKHAIRGGMDVGWGVLLDSTEVYGAGLASAYQLESSRADYPRVVCGAILQDFLEAVIHTESESKLAKVGKFRAKEAKRFLFHDDDGMVMVDFVGEAFYEIASKHPDILPLVRDAFEFVANEQLRFIAYGPDNLAKRYNRLAKYMLNRSELWSSLLISKGLAQARNPEGSRSRAARRSPRSK